MSTLGRWILLLLLASVLLVEYQRAQSDHMTLGGSPLVEPMLVLVLVLLVVGRVVRARGMGRDPRGAAQQAHTRLMPRLRSDEVPAPEVQRRPDPDPALGFDAEGEE